MRESDLDSDREKSLTHSPIGSDHWYRTLCSRIIHIGEYLMEENFPDKNLLKIYGKTLFESGRQLVDNPPDESGIKFERVGDNVFKAPSGALVFAISEEKFDSLIPSEIKKS